MKLYPIYQCLVCYKYIPITYKHEITIVDGEITSKVIDSFPTSETSCISSTECYSIMPVTSEKFQKYVTHEWVMA